MSNELTPNEQELAHSINPDQMVIEGLEITEEEAIEISIRALENNTPTEGAWRWE